MELNKTFYIVYYASKHKKHITRRGKWTDKCREFVAKAGHNCLTFLDLDATERYGKEQYRMATDKITTWSIK